MAALNLATLSVEVQATGVNEAERDINNLTNTIQNSGSSATQATGNMSNGFRGLGSTIGSTIGQTQIFGTSLGSLGSAFTSAGGMATLMQGAVIGLTTALVQMATQAIQKAIAGLGEFVKKGISLASDLTEIQNVLDTTFGDNADQVNEWATTTASAFGLTELSAKQFASTFGAILNGMNITGEQAMRMSEQVAQLAGDMASFYNLEHQEAFDKIRAGLLGETEPLKSLGIVMSETNLATFALQEGLSKTYREMSESEKVVLRYNYLVNQTSLAHGDFAKTSDSFANSQKLLNNVIDDLGKTLAEGFLPQLTEFSNTIAKVLTNLKPVVDLIGTLIGGALQTIFNMLKPMIDLLNAILMVLKPILEFINTIVQSVIDGIKFITDGVGNVINLFAEKMGIVQKQTKETAEYTTETIKEETDEALGYVTTATERWVKEQTDAYRKQLEERYGNTMADYVKIEKLVEQFEKNRTSQAEKYGDVYTRVEKANTQTLEQQLQERNKLEEKYSKRKNVASWSGTGYATGTNYATQGWRMVGEQGRELVYFGGGEKVINNSQTEQIMNSGATHNTFYVTIPANSVKEFVDVVEMCNNAQVNMRMGVE